MKILKLEILNLASLDRQEGEVINFEEGALGDSTIFSIVGPTGSGKSTLLDAICLALYNRAPRYPRKKGARGQNIEIFGTLDDGEKNRLAPSDSRNILTRGKKMGYSKLTFLANNGTVYRAEWNVRFLRTKYENATTSLYKITSTNGKVAEEQADWNDLPTIIGLDYEQFLRTVLIAQGSFAGFLAAKENERYELLEKLIGCEDVYTNIVAKIKQRRDEATTAYNLITADLSAQEKDIIPEDELPVLTARIAQLQEEEQKAKAELGKVTEALTWYATEEKFVANIALYEVAFTTAKQNLEAVKDEADRLNLHDSTLKAVDLYKGITTSQTNIGKHSADITKLDGSIDAMQKSINAEKGNLNQLRNDAQTAAKEWEVQRPHIINARNIKTELNAASKVVADLKNQKTEADRLLNAANKAVDDNAKAIEQANAMSQNAKVALDGLQKRIEYDSQEIDKKVTDAQKVFDDENIRLSTYDADKLQEAKTEADRTINDLTNAIRLLEDINAKIASINVNEYQRQELTKRNSDIAEELKHFNLTDLKDEIDTLTKSHALMTSKDWKLHRHNLVEGQPCPLCGSTVHPYHKPEDFLPVVDKMKKLLDEKKELLNRLQDRSQKLNQELSRNQGLLNGLENVLKSLGEDMEKLTNEWAVVKERHNDWSKDVDALKAKQPEVEDSVRRADADLRNYTLLMASVDRLRKVKESAEKEQRNFAETSAQQKKVAEDKLNLTNTQLETERGKTANLIQQQTEKKEALDQTVKKLEGALRDVDSKKNALKQEIGDKDPDVLDKQLEDARTKANNAVEKTMTAIGKQREDLNRLNGNLQTTKEQLEKEKGSLTQATADLGRWIASYNAQHEHHLDVKDIENLYNATDNWEAIRAKQRSLSTALTSAETMLHNEKKNHEVHQEKKPTEQKEQLENRRSELELFSTEELVNLKARMQNHDKAKELMGNMFEQKQAAEKLKKEWEEICDAIGGDGKTLRKIAQCYTLRFLIEHANVEIRKFNTRYELQQVHNSLGIRVIDHDRADDVRDTTSLSGGETFIVSLGLALGLSALSSRNISFENLFIDEGFGTLDPETLATVIDSLAMLQSSQGKKVGVISHTDTMSERITTQIRVIKNGHSGSSHIEIYP